MPCLLACLSSGLPVFWPACLLACLSSGLPVFWPACLLACLSSGLLGAKVSRDRLLRLMGMVWSEEHLELLQHLCRQFVLGQHPADGIL